MVWGLVIDIERNQHKIFAHLVCVLVMVCRFQNALLVLVTVWENCVNCFHVSVVVPPVHLKYNKILLTISVTFWTESDIIHSRIGQIPEHLSKDVDSESEDKVHNYV